jgi:hypothetical protein
MFFGQADDRGACCVCDMKVKDHPYVIQVALKSFCLRWVELISIYDECVFAGHHRHVYDPVQSPGGFKKSCTAFDARVT